MKKILTGFILAASAMAPGWAQAAAPAVDNNGGASNILSISATVNGTLTSTGGVPTQVYVYWGTADGGTNSGSWGVTNNLGTNGVGLLSLGLTNLTPNQTYYYRFFATNATGSAWASATTNFQTLASASPLPIDLGEAAHFMILATATTTTTGGGYIDGDVGLSPAGSQGIPEDQINGIIYNGGPIAAQAQVALTAAITAASPAQLPDGIDVGAELGGKTLVAGVYKSPSGAYDITSVDLTLNGGPDDVWVFQMASTLTVGTGRQVILTGGARAKNIFWQVGSSATLGTSSVFKGTIMAYASITMNISSTLDGRALAQVGAVTFNGDGGRLPIPVAPVFTSIVATDTNCTMAIRATPDFLLTLETTPNLLAPDWTPIDSATPTNNNWTFIDNTAPSITTQRFYRAFTTE